MYNNPYCGCVYPNPPPFSNFKTPHVTLLRMKRCVSFSLRGGDFFLGAISFGRVVPSHKIVINLPRTYEKPPCKGELYRFSNRQTHKQTSFYFIIRIKGNLHLNLNKILMYIYNLQNRKTVVENNFLMP